MLQQSETLDRVFHALSDPGRRAMLDRLTSGPASLGDLAAPLNMTLSAVGQHLKVLEAANLVSSRKTGRVRMCRLDTDGIAQAQQWLEQRRSMWEGHLDRLGAYLETTEPEEQS